jgi:hypothetical protein
MVGMVARVALTFGLLLATSSSQEKGTDSSSTRPPLPRPAAVERIAGIPGFHSLSTVVFPSAPERPHVLDATYVFPERVRLWLGVEAGAATSRQLQYRFGASVFEVPDRSAESRELEGAARDSLLRSMELRRAWMMWPDGFRWTSEGSQRTADLGALGKLRARVASGNDTRPTELASLDPAGAVDVELKDVRWREENARFWPASAEIWHAGALAWREKIDSIDTHGVFVDAYFVPADRRADAAPPKSSPDAIQVRELPEYCAKRVEFAAGITWDLARTEEARIRREIAAELKPRGLELEGRVTIDVTAEGVPRACLVRLASVPAELPPGFIKTPAREGLAQLVTSFSEVTPARLASVRASAPAGRPTEAAYVRFPVSDEPPTQVLIVVPLALKN